MKWLRSLLLIASVFVAARSLAQTNQYRYPFQNPNLPLEDRVDNIVSLANFNEKVILLSAVPGLPRLGIWRMENVQGLHGLAHGGPSTWGRTNPVPTTIFPQAMGLGETWDPDLLRQVSSVIGYETRYIYQSGKYDERGGLIVLAPNADLGRDPRWGRTEECYGEDPFFNGTMVTAYVRGLQGDNPKYWLTAALLKHFVANSNENGRYKTSSDFDEALFREYYSVPFRMGFQEGGARCVLAAYNEWNHIPCTVHPALRNVLMAEWGVDGVICTDRRGSPNLIDPQLQHYYTNAADAVTGELKAGINQFHDYEYANAIEKAIARRLLTRADLDQNVKGVVRTLVRLGMADSSTNNPYASIGRHNEPEPCLSEKHKSIARRATQESIVLLKNSQDLLPLDKTKLKSIAVIGPRANEVLLDWYSGTPPYRISAVEGIKSKVGAGVIVNSCTNDDSAEMVRLAAASDIAVVCVGNNPIGVPDGHWARVSVPSEGREAVDRDSISLEQEDLIKQVFAANPKTVVALISSFPYAINWSQTNVPAIVHLTQCSEELGNGLADVLFGDYNPAGRLVETWPQSLDQLPPMMDYNIRDGRTYMYFKGAPLYPFGYGLSYTTFEYSNLKTSSDTLPKNSQLTVSVEVKNTGSRAGDEVVQLYVKHAQSAFEHPSEELRAFKRVSLTPGETKTVEMPLAAGSLGYWNTSTNGFVVEPGDLELRVGASSADIRLKKTISISN